jgi:hypothetical protein
VVGLDQFFGLKAAAATDSARDAWRIVCVSQSTTAGRQLIPAT